jgi:acetyl esterase/lipase
MRSHFFASFFILASLAAVSQESPVKYRNFVFPRILVEKNVSYKTVLQAGTKSKYYLMDLYQPANDSTLYRPLIIWIHGGGFKFGTKKTRGTPVWSSSFAQRGYVCAAVNYRLSKKRPLARFKDLADGCYEGIEDIREAVLFLKKNSRLYHIDTNRIVLAGNSAGGIIALQAVYSNLAELSKLAGRADSVTAPVTYNTMHIAAVISFWGAVFDPQWLQHALIPVVCVYGSKDRVVPYEHKGPLFGSLAIHQQADSLHIPNELKTYEGWGHELQKHFNPIFSGGKAKKHWLEAGQFAADFLYRQLFIHLSQ